MCQNYQGRDQIGTPDVALRCARTAKIDWTDSGAGRCAGMDGSGTGAEGIRLLQKSIWISDLLSITCATVFFFPFSMTDLCSL